MHVRGSSLSQPKVIAALRPFVVAFWGQANDEPIPEDLRLLYAASGPGGSNVRCFVLDADGALVHSFNGFPGHSPNPVAYTTEQYASYFAGEIARGAAALRKAAAAPAAERPLKLPEVTSGVRLFIRVPGGWGSYAYPVVEAVENRDEWAQLAYPREARTVEAAKLARWLRLCYPPGVNEQLEPFGSVRGALRLEPDGAHGALLSGKVSLARSEAEAPLFEGTLEAVLTYATSGSGVTLRGVVDGVYRRWEPRRNQWAGWKLVTAIESLPK